MTVTAPPRPSHQDELEALIEEARRRARRRRYRNALMLAAVAVAGLYAGFGGSGGSGANGDSAAGGAPGQPGSHAATQPFPDAPQSQRFPTFGRCPLAPPNRYLPRRAGCVTVRRADVDGDGRRDLVLLYARLDARGYPIFSSRDPKSGFTLKVVRRGRSVVAAHVPRGDLNARILRAADLNARAGIELLVHEYHVTTSEGVGVYTFGRDTLRRAHGFVFDGSDAGIVSGLTCNLGPPATIVQHVFTERIPFRGVWDRVDTTYRWVGAALRRVGTRKVTASPTRRQVGVHC
jgi:hypothetical protein